MEDRLYQVIDQFNERKITSTQLYLILLNKIRQFYDENCRTCKILFVNDDTIRQNIQTNFNNIYSFDFVKQFNTRYKMNKIVNKFLLAGEKFMSEIHLTQPGFVYSARGLFTKNKERIQKI